MLLNLYMSLNKR